MDNKEIEIQVRIKQSQPLLDFLKSNAEFKSENKQVDEYFNPPDRDFTTERPVKEWIRLRDTNSIYSLNYKNWHYGADGKSTHCDEYETEVKDLAQIKNIFSALGFKSKVRVDKIRKS